jgi:hypothetical protein
VDPAASKSRGRSSYFSEFRYSSLPSRTARPSKSSKPEYTPHDVPMVEASTARMANIPGPPCCKLSCRMSGVLTNRFGRVQSAYSAIC